MTRRVGPARFRAPVLRRYLDIAPGRGRTSLSPVRTLAQVQQAQDVTQAVADVASRVASARAAIAQLRALLARAGSVSSLLTVQEQISQQEAALEALESQQRALARETSYATIALTVVSPPPAVHRHPPARGGFGSGLAAGWHGLRTLVRWLLTAAGAALPFAVPLALIAAAGWQARRWLVRRRAGARPAS